MSLEAFLVGLGNRLALSLAGDLVKGLGIWAARGFSEPEVPAASSATATLRSPE